MTVILGTYASILNPCYEENVHTYATTKEMINKMHLREVVRKKSRMWHSSDLHFGN